MLFRARVTTGFCPAIAVTSATLVGRAGQTGDNMVDLVTAAQTPGKTYTVTINGVKDDDGCADTGGLGGLIDTIFGGYSAKKSAHRFPSR